MGRSASIWCVIVSVSLICWQGAPATLADDSYAQNATRLEKMTADQKDDLRRKKLRFDALGSDEQQKLRDLHASISKVWGERGFDSHSNANTAWSNISG